MPAENVSDFIFRETTYWSKVAQKAIDDKKMTYWAVLEKVGGTDLEHSANYLFINTVPDVDALANVFNATAVFPDMPASSMDTNGLSTTTSVLFLHDENRTQAANAAKGTDFAYVTINYHNSSDTSAFINLEREHWMPFIKSAMDKTQTSQRGWANASVIAPQGPDVPFNSVSYDYFPSLQKALMPGWSTGVVFPQDGIDSLNKLRVARMATSIYRVVKVVSAN